MGWHEYGGDALQVPATYQLWAWSSCESPTQSRTLGSTPGTGQATEVLHTTTKLRGSNHQGSRCNQRSPTHAPNTSRARGEGLLLHAVRGRHKPHANLSLMNFARMQEQEKKKIVAAHKLPATTRHLIKGSKEEIYLWQGRRLNALSHPPLLPMAPNFPPGTQPLLSRDAEK